MTSYQKRHLWPLLFVILCALIPWLIGRVSIWSYLYLVLGLGLGAFFLDIDHLVFWLYLGPNNEEARLARLALSKYDFRSLIKLTDLKHADHTDLIFHHFFFQVVLSLISLFVFTSSGNIFGMAFLLACHIHLLVDEYFDYRSNKQHLQEWLFARETKQLPIDYLGKYLAIFVGLTFIFMSLLIKSAL